MCRSARQLVKWLTNELKLGKGWSKSKDLHHTVISGGDGENIENRPFEGTSRTG